MAIRIARTDVRTDDSSLHAVLVPATQGDRDLDVLQTRVARNLGTTLEKMSVGYLPDLAQFRGLRQRAH